MKKLASLLTINEIVPTSGFCGHKPDQKSFSNNVSPELTLKKY